MKKIRLSMFSPKSGIYKITNMKNGKIYIGQSINISMRWANHVDGLSNGKHSNPRLLEDFRTIGSKFFVAEIIEECERDLLLKRERYYISLYYKQGCELYNKTDYDFVEHDGRRYRYDYESHLDKLEE